MTHILHFSTGYGCNISKIISYIHSILRVHCSNKQKGFLCVYICACMVWPKIYRLYKIRKLFSSGGFVCRSNVGGGYVVCVFFVWLIVFVCVRVWVCMNLVSICVGLVFLHFSFGIEMAASVVVAAKTASSSPPVVPNVITVLQEKQFIRTTIFAGDVEQFHKSNIYFRQREETDATDKLLPLTSVIYTPNKRFLEKSKFFRDICNGIGSKFEIWLQKNNVLVLVYGVTSILDHHLNAQQNVYNDSFLIMDIAETNGCLSSSHVYIPHVFKNDDTLTTTSPHDDMITLIRFENSPFNHRLNSIKERIQSLYHCNYLPINYLLFNDLNNEDCIHRFKKNTINVSLA